MGSRNGSTVLVVEDEPLVGMELAEDLIRWGYQVPEVVTSGDEVLNAANRHRPDLVLMDIRIRGSMDGIEAAARLKQNSDVPVVFLTAYSDSATLERAARTLPEGYLLKPFGEKELVANVEMALHKAQSRVRADASSRALNQTLMDLLPRDGLFAQRLDSAGFVLPSPLGAGDFYDLFPLGPHHFLFYSLDVEGCGPLPAMVVYSLRSAIRELAGTYFAWNDEIPAPSVLLTALNEKFEPRGDASLFFTLTLGIVVPLTGEFQLARAGHTRTLWQSANGSLQWLQGEGSALGAFPHVRFEELEGRLQSGDRLILCSDGLLEALGNRDLDRGYTVLADLVLSHAQKQLSDLTSAVREACLKADAKSADDVSLLVLGPKLW